MKNLKTKIIHVHIKLPERFTIPLFTIPLFSKLTMKFEKISKKRKRLILITLIIGIIGVAGYILYSTVTHTITNQQKATEVTQSKQYTGTSLQTPDYTTILPTGKTIEALGGWTRVSPSNRNPVFAFVDKIDSKPINVSEQPLPPELKDDKGNQDDSQIVQLAQGYNANDKVIVGQTTVYIGTSAKGPQSVIFGKNNLLILIKSSVVLTNDQWAGYVSSLK